MNDNAPIIMRNVSHETNERDGRLRSKILKDSNVACRSGHNQRPGARCVVGTRKLPFRYPLKAATVPWPGTDTVALRQRCEPRDGVADHIIEQQARVCIERGQRLSEHLPRSNHQHDARKNDERHCPMDERILCGDFEHGSDDAHHDADLGKYCFAYELRGMI